MPAISAAPPAPAPEAKPAAPSAGLAVGREDKALFAKLVREQDSEPARAKPPAVKDKPKPGAQAKPDDAPAEGEPTRAASAGDDASLAAAAAAAGESPVPVEVRADQAQSPPAEPAASEVQPDQSVAQAGAQVRGLPEGRIEQGPTLPAGPAPSEPPPGKSASAPGAQARGAATVAPAAPPGLSVAEPKPAPTPAAAQTPSRTDVLPAQARIATLSEPLAAPDVAEPDRSAPGSQAQAQAPAQAQAQSKAPAVPATPAEPAAPAQPAAAAPARPATPPVVQAEAAPAAFSAPLIDAQVMTAVQGQAAPAQGAPAQPSGKATAAAATAKTAVDAASGQARGLFALAEAAAGPSTVPAAAPGGEAGAEQGDPGADASTPGPDLAQPDAAAGETKLDASGQPFTVSSQTAASGAGGLANAQAHGGTVSSLAAQIVRKSEGKASRFEVQLDPLGLGQVKVSVRIDAQGRLSAALAFDNPQAAAQLNARSGELRAALEQAGFDLSQGGLSFGTAGGEFGGQTPGEGFGRAEDQEALFRGRAFGAVSQAVDEADLGGRLPARRAAATGLDLRI